MITPEEARIRYPFSNELTTNERNYFLCRGYRRRYFAENEAGQKVTGAHTERRKIYGEAQRSRMPWPVWAHPFRSYHKAADVIPRVACRWPPSVCELMLSSGMAVSPSYPLGLWRKPAYVELAQC